MAKIREVVENYLLNDGIKVGSKGFQNLTRCIEIAIDTRKLNEPVLITEIYKAVGLITNSKGKAVESTITSAISKSKSETKQCKAYVAYAAMICQRKLDDEEEMC